MTATFNLGQFIKNYEIIGYLGEGGFGQVFKVKNILDSCFYAMKIIDLEGPSGFEDSAQQEIEALRHLGKEAKNNCCIYLIKEFVFLNFRCIILPLMGLSLADMLKNRRNNSLDTNKIRVITSQLCKALEFVHSKGIAHSDLKLENVLFRQKNINQISELDAIQNIEVCLIDFGCSTFNEFESNVIVSTRAYRAPENLSSEEFFRASDIWALGIMILSLYTGYQIFPFDSEAPRPFQHRLDHLHLAAIEILTDENLNINATARKELYTHFGRSIPMKLQNYQRSAKDKTLFSLLKEMLMPRPEDRIDVHQILQHDFFSEK